MTRTQRLVLSIAVLASFVSFLDGSVINVALPAISAELGGGLSTQQWVVDAYLITLGSLILVAGSLSDVYGRIVVIRAGLIGFGSTSLMCAFAPTAEFLIISRGLQGIAGALLVPSSLALILSTFRGPAQGKAIGLWTAWTSGAFLAGPVLGGLFVDFLSWRWVFAINILPIAVTLGLLLTLGQKDERQTGVRIDWVSALLGVVGLAGPVFALIEQDNFGLSSPVIWVSFVVGVISLAAFIRRQQVVKDPMMPLGLFGVRNFGFGNVATVFIYGALSLGSFVLTVYLQQTVGYSATLAGAAFLPVTILNIALSTWVGSLSGRFGPRLFMTAGPLLAGVGFLLTLGLGEGANYVTEVLPGILVFGLGLTLTVAPLTSAILGSISERQAGIGSAINNALARIAGLVTIALVGVIVGTLDAEGYQRGIVVTAVLLFVGAIVSFAGIRNPPREAASTKRPPEA